LINIPLDSMRGVSRLLKCLPSDKLEMFHISLLIRIRPFLENQSLDIRETAIVLFGDLCHQVITNSTKETDALAVGRTSEAFREQLHANLFSMLLHLCENEQQIVHVSDETTVVVLCD
jgi:maestro heat-like repeat-containing protein family member 1